MPLSLVALLPPPRLALGRRSRLCGGGVAAREQARTQHQAAQRGHARESRHVSPSGEPQVRGRRCRPLLGRHRQGGGPRQFWLVSAEILKFPITQLRCAFSGVVGKYSQIYACWRVRRRLLFIIKRSFLSPPNREILSFLVAVIAVTSAWCFGGGPIT